VPPPFYSAKPLQAAKLVAVAGTLGFGVLGAYRVLPDQQLAALLTVPVVSLALALVVTAETLVAGYRLVRAGPAASDRLAARPAYTLVRGVEAVAAAFTVGGTVVVIERVPDGPMAGPGAMGLLFVVVGLGLAVMGGSLLRTLTEYYYHRRARLPAETAPAASG